MNFGDITLLFSIPQCMKIKCSKVPVASKQHKHDVSLVLL